MVKNVKIDDEVHRQMSILSSELSQRKSDICSALIALALERMTTSEILEYVAKFSVTVTENDAKKRQN